MAHGRFKYSAVGSIQFRSNLYSSESLSCILFSSWNSQSHNQLSPLTLTASLSFSMIRICISVYFIHLLEIAILSVPSRSSALASGGAVIVSSGEYEVV